MRSMWQKLFQTMSMPFQSSDRQIPFCQIMSRNLYTLWPRIWISKAWKHLQLAQIKKSARNWHSGGFRIMSETEKRSGRDSNPRPPAWQAGILTYWTTGPIFWFISHFSDSCAWPRTRLASGEMPGWHSNLPDLLIIPNLCDRPCDREKCRTV